MQTTSQRDRYWVPTLRSRRQRSATAGPAAAVASAREVGGARTCAPPAAGVKFGLALDNPDYLVGSAGWTTLAITRVQRQLRSTMFIETRTLGRKARPLDGWTIPEPPINRDGDGENLTLRELIARVVRTQVTAFEE